MNEQGNQPPPEYCAWDRGVLDREYSPSSCVERPVEEFVAEYAERSTRAREHLPGIRNLRYDVAPDATLDLFVGVGSRRALQIFFHGGYWSALCKDDFSYLACAFVARGAAFACINYSLMPAVNIDVIVHQSRLAVAWLANQASRYDLDPDRFYVSGHSAGAHLAAMCLHTDWRHFCISDPTLLKGGCLISGIYDLEPLRHVSENAVFRLNAQLVDRNSPLKHLPLAHQSLIVCHGEHETSEFKRQSRAYHLAASATGVRSRLLALAGHHHFDVLSEVAREDSELFRAVFAQMNDTQ